MRKAQSGDKVKVHYTGTLDDGRAFDSSRGRDPLMVHLGAGELIIGFEKALFGMEVGEVKQVKISPNEAYGDYSLELVKSVDRKFLPPHIHPVKGMQLQLGENEDMTIVTITEVDEQKITLDANHPLAGKPLNFEIELVEIV